MALQGFLRGFFSPLRAAGFLLSHKGLKRYALIPLLFNLLAFGLILAAFFRLFARLDVENYSPAWMGAFGQWALAIGKWGFAFALYLFLLLYGFTAVGLVLAGPWNDLLSEKVEAVFCGGGEGAGLKFSLWLRATMHTLWDSLSIVLREGLFTILALPFLLIPVVGVLPLLFVGAYYGGLGFYDIPLARHFLRPDHRRAGLAGKRWEWVGLGSAMMFFLLVPLAGLVFLPLGVTAATLSYCEVDWAGRLAEADLKPPPGFVAPVKGGARE
ncbi:MAG: EI24 domain-containing protein [Planctomycetota bacterium]